MRKKRSTNTATARKRSSIIEAALACFSEIGFVDTTMEDIRKRSKASNGSIYHHFKSKEQLAAAVYLDGIRKYQSGMLDKLGKCREPRQAIHSMITHHLAWSSDNQAWASYLSDMRHAAFMKNSEESMVQENSRFAETIWSFFTPFIKDGTLKRLPPEFYIAIILGPCLEYSRYLLKRSSTSDWKVLASQFTEAAWQAVKSKKTTD